MQTNDRVAAAARVATVGAVLGLEVGVASNHLWTEPFARGRWLFAGCRLGFGCTAKAHIRAVDLGGLACQSQFAGHIAHGRRTVARLGAHRGAGPLGRRRAPLPLVPGVARGAARCRSVQLDSRVAASRGSRRDRCDRAAHGATDRRSGRAVRACRTSPGGFGPDRLVRRGAVGHRDDAARTRLVALARCRADTRAARRRGSDRRWLGCVRRQLLGRVRGRVGHLLSTRRRGDVLPARLPRGPQLAAATDRRADLRGQLARDSRILVSFFGRWSCCFSLRC